VLGGRRSTPSEEFASRLIRNQTWVARRATVGPHLAALSGQRRSLRVSPTGVCSTARGVEYFQAGHASSILVTRSDRIAPCHSGY
jgi:hypothetical protein